MSGGSVLEAECTRATSSPTTAMPSSSVRANARRLSPRERFDLVLKPTLFFT
jgi:hypothetical protein